MNDKNADAVRRRLESFTAPEPPAGLLDRIKNEIPGELPVMMAGPSETSSARWWQVAAAMILMIGGGWLAWTWTRDPLAPGRMAELRTDAPPAAEEALPRAEAEPDAASAPPPSSQELTSALADGSQTVSPSSAPAPVAQQSRAMAGEERDASALSRDEAKVENRSQFAERFRLDAAAASAPPRPAAPPPPAVAPPPPSASKLEMRGRNSATPGVIGGVTGSRPEETQQSEASVSRKSVIVTAEAPEAGTTGGTTEPNDDPYGDVFFSTSGVNPFIDTEDDAQSTFGLDVDTGSYTVARRYLRDGYIPPPEAIRVEEFVNYFHYGDRAPARDDFALYADGARWPFPRGDRYYALRFGVRGREITAASRKPATLVFTVDVSGSMAQQNRLGLVKQALGLLLGQLDKRDRIGLVVYGSSGQVLLEPTADHEAIRRAIERLEPAGSTNAEEGLVLAYELAGRHFRRGEINRVILCSDGVANVGRTGPESILDRIGEAARRGIELTTVGFGMGNYNDVLMEQLANKGNGHYAYVDSLAEAQRVFVENLTGTLQTIARDAKVQVEFEPSTVARYRLLGYENRDIADERFRDDSVDAGEIGAGHSVTALYEIKLHPEASRDDLVGTLRLRYEDVDRGDRVVEVERPLFVRDIDASWARARTSVRLAVLVATFAEMLKESYWVKDLKSAEVLREIERLSESSRDRQVDELAQMVRAAAAAMDESSSRRRALEK